MVFRDVTERPASRYVTGTPAPWIGSRLVDCRWQENGGGGGSRTRVRKACRRRNLHA